MQRGKRKLMRIPANQFDSFLVKIFLLISQTNVSSTSLPILKVMSRSDFRLVGCRGSHQELLGYRLY